MIYMTRAELVSKSEAIQKSAKRLFLPLLVYVLLLAGFLWWANFHKDIFSERTIGFIGIAGFLGIYVILIVTALFAVKRRKGFGCACPNCKKELVAGVLRLAIASGRCGHCGGIVVDDWNK
jgi:pilus assembly protein TadC